MKHVVKPKCKYNCRILQVTDSIWLCPHLAYGEGTDLKGAVEAARELIDRAGGYDAVLARVENAESQRREEAKQKRDSKAQRIAESVKYR